MQELIEIPPFLEALHVEAQRLAAELAAALTPLGRREWHDAKVDLLALDPVAAYYIHDGFLKYLVDGKIVRVYYTGDLVPPQTRLPSGDAQLFGEFGTETTAVPVRNLLLALRADPALHAKWNDFSAIDNRILHVLCALHMSAKSKPRVVVKSFRAGEVVIKEGSKPDAIFLLIEGEAAVTVKSIEVGRVHSGEIFGEVSFLTDHPRTATVIASARCMVQAIDEEEFLRLIRVKPQMAVDVAKTLARRLMELNERVAHEKVI